MSDVWTAAAMVLTGVVGILGAIYPGVRKLLRSIVAVEGQLKPNGGDSLRDRIEKILAKQKAFHATFEGTKRAAFDLVPAPVFEAKPDGSCEFVNLEYCDRLGITRDQALGKGWLALVTTDDRDRVRQAWAEAVRDSGHFSESFRLMNRQNRTVLRVDCRAVPITGSDGSVLSYVGFLKPTEIPK